MNLTLSHYAVIKLLTKVGENHDDVKKWRDEVTKTLLHNESEQVGKLIKDNSPELNSSLVNVGKNSTDKSLLCY